MYEFVYESESKRYRSDCSRVLKKTCALLMEKNIIAQFTLVGSGARNMVTKNGNGPFDLDYNLEIIEAPDRYLNNLCYLKDTIRVALDQATELTCFSPSQNSKSCLTALLHFKDTPNIKFYFDVAIVKKNSKGTLCRLILNPFIGSYTWNEVPNSRDVAKKAAQLKENDLWTEVRECYIDLKNQYLRCFWEKDHPSFVVYIEAVNTVYNQYFARA